MVKEEATETSITPGTAVIDVGMPPSIWMESLTKGQQSTDSISASNDRKGVPD